MTFSPVPCHLVPLRPKYSSQQLFEVCFSIPFCQQTVYIVLYINPFCYTRQYKPHNSSTHYICSSYSTNRTFYCFLRAGIAQSVQRLATGRTVRGSNPGCGREFPHLSRPALGPTRPPIQWVLGVKRPGCGTDYPPISTAEVKERVKLYLYPLWAFMASSRVNFYLFYVGHLESKERLRIQPAQLFNFS